MQMGHTLIELPQDNSEDKNYLAELLIKNLTMPIKNSPISFP